MKKLVAFAAVIAAVSFKLQQKKLRLLKVIQLLLKLRLLKLKLLLLNNHSAISDEDSLYACNIQTFFVFKLM